MKFKALVEDPGKWPGRVERDRAEHRLDFVDEIVAQPLQLRRIPAGATNEAYVFCFQGGNEFVVEQAILLVDQLRALARRWS